MCEVLDQPTINQYWNSSKVHLLKHELAIIYIAGAQHNVTLSENLWPNRQERQEVKDDCTVIPTAMHVQFTLRRFSYVHISSNDMVCQQITVQTVKA